MQLMQRLGPAVYMSCMSQIFHFVKRIQFIRSKHSNFSTHVAGASESRGQISQAGTKDSIEGGGGSNVKTAT